MKKIKSFLLFTFLGTAVLSSCTKPTTDPAPAPVASTNMTCLVDGVTWSSKAGGSILQGMMNVTGVQASDGQTIVLTLNGTATGTYTLGPGQSSAAAYKPNSNSSTEGYATGNTGTSGTVTVTSIDATAKTMSGTYSFVALRGSDNAQKTITNGTFTNVTYTGTVPVTTSSASAKINGNAWTTKSVFGITSGSTLAVSCTKTSGETIGFSLPSNITPGTYTFAPFGTYTAQYNANSSTFYQAQSGSITIVSKTAAEMTATFSFSATNLSNMSDVVSVTEGTLDLKF